MADIKKLFFFVIIFSVNLILQGNTNVSPLSSNHDNFNVVNENITGYSSDCFEIDLSCGSWFLPPKQLRTHTLDVEITQRCLFKRCAGCYFKTVYTLISAPNGMSINSDGVISWVAPITLLNQTIQVIVKVDQCSFSSGNNLGSYGSATCTLNVTITKNPF